MEEEKKDTKLDEKKEEKKATDKKATAELKKETKKQETSKDTKKKKVNNVIMIAVIAIVVLLLIAILIGMSLKTDSPKKAVETMLGELKAGSFSQSILSSFSLIDEENADQEVQKLLFNKLEWDIQNVTEEGEKATVEVEITNKDFETVIGNYMQKVLKVAFSGQTPNEEEMTNYLMEELNNDEIQTVTSNQSIIVEKKDGKWEVSEENDFITILLPGFNEAISAFNN